ncbi:hypothetical protein Goklo_020693, partial [Gossypium klotzschianum]|nr:hypothetical protein [Gossypium klotzschianum]
MLEGCKLDPTLITAVVERWRPRTHTFHLPCSECTIALEDVDLQLNLSVDGSIFTSSAIVLGKEDFYEAFLGRYIPKDAPDILVSDKSRNLLRCIRSCVRQRNRIKCQSVVAYSYCNHGPDGNYHFYVPDYVGLPEQLEDIWLLFDQQSEAEYVGREGVVDSVRDGGDARTGYSDAIVRVEETNFVATVRHSSESYIYYWCKRGVGNFVRRGHDDHPSNFDVIIDAQVIIDIFGTTSHSNTEKGDRYKDEVEGGDEDEDNGGDEDKGDNGDKDEHKGGGEDEENKDNGHNQVEEPTPLVVHRNP